jgi:hypothetical protein
MMHFSNICRLPLQTNKIQIKKKKNNTFVSSNRFYSLPVDNDFPEVFSPSSVIVTHTAKPESTAPLSNHLGDEKNDYS